MKHTQQTSLLGFDIARCYETVHSVTMQSHPVLLENAQAGHDPSADTVVAGSWCVRLTRVAKVIVGCKNRPRHPLPLSDVDDLPVPCHDPR